MPGVRIDSRGAGCYNRFQRFPAFSRGQICRVNFFIGSGVSLIVNDNSLIRFQLYRIKLIRPHQAQLTSDNMSAAQLLREAIDSRPEQGATPDITWHIGNVMDYPNSKALYFRIGRTTMSTLETFDEEAKNFVEESIESSPYTHCIVLVDLGVVAIVHKSRLAAKTQAIASRMRKLLELTDIVDRNRISVEVDPLPDPQSFIEAIENAYAVLVFTATFRGPNPIDADEVFQKPLAQIASVTSAEQGRIKLHGEDLERDALANIARSTAATGNTASVKIRDEKGQRTRTVKMEKSPAELVYQDGPISPEQVAADLRTRYAEVRGNE